MFNTRRSLQSVENKKRQQTKSDRHQPDVPSARIERRVVQHEVPIAGLQVVSDFLIAHAFNSYQPMHRFAQILGNRRITAR